MLDLKKINSLLKFHDLLTPVFKDVLGVNFDQQFQTIEFHEKLELPHVFTLNMGLNNDDYKSLLSFNFQKEFITEILNIDDIDLGMDAMGEALNTLAGSLAYCEDIKKEFGELVQSPPMSFRSQVIFPNAFALRGSVQISNFSLYFGFLIQPSSSSFDKRY